MLSSSHNDVLTCCESVHASELDWCEVWTIVCWCIVVSCCRWRYRSGDWCSLWLITIPIQLLKLELLLPWFVASSSCSSLVIGRSRGCRSRGWRRWRARRVVEGIDCALELLDVEELLSNIQELLSRLVSTLFSTNTLLLSSFSVFTFANNF